MPTQDYEREFCYSDINKLSYSEIIGLSCYDSEDHLLVTST